MHLFICDSKLNKTFLRNEALNVDLFPTDQMFLWNTKQSIKFRHIKLI